MDYFFVSPIESLLLGFAWGVYLHHKKRDPETRFVPKVASRLHPFLPVLRQIREIAVPEDTLPQDIEWLPLSDSTEKGFSPSSPDRQFIRSSEGIVCKIVDTSRKSFIDLLVSYLGDHLVGLAPIDQIGNSRKIEHEFFKSINELGLAEAHHRFITPNHEDNDDGIDQALIDLMVYNECNDHFSTGKCFGTLMALCESQEPEDQFAGDTGLAKFLDTLAQLLKMKLVKRDLISTSVLQRVESNAISLSNDIWKSFNLSTLDSLQQDTAVMALWVAFGEAFAFLEDVERVTRDQEWGSIRTRTFRDLFDQSGDKVRTAIAEEERRLNEGDGASDLPRQIIASLSPAVEAIVRRHFVFVDSRHPARDMMALLNEKLRFGSVNEKRFASIAIGLYSQYRNTVTHEYEKYCYSFEEVRYFIAGLRALMVLGEQIAHNR